MKMSEMFLRIGKFAISGALFGVACFGFYDNIKYCNDSDDSEAIHIIMRSKEEES